MEPTDDGFNMTMASWIAGRDHAYWTALMVSTALALAGAAGCRDRAPRKSSPDAAVASASAAPLGKRKGPKPVVSSKPAPPPVIASASDAHFDPDAGAPARSQEFDLGLVAPAAVGPFGAAIVKGDDEVVVVPFQNGKFGAAPADVKTSQASWPVVVEGSPSRLYWSSKGRLLRRKITNDGVVGALEVLATDVSEQYLRVAAAHDEKDPNLDVVLYIGSRVSKEKEHLGRIWLEGRKPKYITPEGGGATAVSVVPIAPGRFALIAVDGRLSLSPVHTRFLELTPEPTMTEDRVVHVAGPADAPPDLAAMLIGGAPVAFTTISKESTEFGLLSLAIGTAEADAPATWLLYPNGITPAPVVGATICDKPMLAFLQPETAKPDSDAVVRVGTANAAGHLDDVTSIASAPKIRHLAIAPIASRAKDAKGKTIGGLMLYSTETNIKAAALYCK